MTSDPGMTSKGVQGIDAVLLAHRPALLRFLAAHGTAGHGTAGHGNGDEAEDLFHELWLRVTQAPTGPIGNPLAYLYRAANNLAIDRHRARRQAEARDHAWAEGREAQAPGADRQLMSRQELAGMEAVLAALGDRVTRVVHRFRLDGVPQRQIAAELGVSLSTVESDLRRAYAALIAARKQSDDA